MAGAETAATAMGAVEVAVVKGMRVAAEVAAVVMEGVVEAAAAARAMVVAAKVVAVAGP